MRFASTRLITPGHAERQREVAGGEDCDRPDWTLVRTDIPTSAGMVDHDLEVGTLLDDASQAVAEAGA